jgi:nitroreductase
MDVSDAIRRRKSIRAFLDTPVDDETVAELLELAARAPSGGNVQPWRIYVIGAETMPRFREFLAGREMEAPGYDIYPPGLWEPYRTNRFGLGEAMYDTLGIAREDTAARFAHLARNYRLLRRPGRGLLLHRPPHGPPAVVRPRHVPADVHARSPPSAGLDTCPQEAWAIWPQAVAEFVGAPDDEMLFCGVAVGHADPDAPVNQLESERMPLDAVGHLRALRDVTDQQVDASAAPSVTVIDTYSGVTKERVSPRDH